MNLIHDAWLPIRRRSGVAERIAPWQVTERFAEDPVITLASPRADFDGALIQFLLGLLETALNTPGARERFRRMPPDPLHLREVFAPLAGAFELFGAGARFLQDLTIESESPGEEPIERLLIEAPGANTAKLGKDHFVKAGRVRCLCPACAAAAVLTLQINAPSGGQGHRTGIRGGGPLTTLVVDPESLWGTLAANLLDADSSPGRRAAGRTSERGTGRETTWEDVDPLQVYWAMPRRIRLAVELADTPGAPAVADASGVAAPTCDLCGATAAPAVRSYLALNLGVNYTGPWEHPFSPHGIDATSGLPFPVKGGQVGAAYRQWLGLVQSFEEARRHPARVVTEFKRRLERTGSRRPAAGACGGYQLWAFGYDMDNMKARAWVESRMPLLLADAEHREEYERQVGALVRAARQAERALLLAAKEVVSGRPEELEGDPGDLGARFWEETEPLFFAHLRRLQEELAAGGEQADPRPVRASWWRSLRQVASRGFEGFCGDGFVETTDPRRIALAWQGLQKVLRGPRMLALLGPSTPEEPAIPVASISRPASAASAATTASTPQTTRTPVAELEPELAYAGGVR
jgi:CRISPR system Cascade subunit CasA